MVAVLSAVGSALAWFLVRYLIVVVMFYLLAYVSPLAGFAARILASWIALVSCAIYGVFASIALRLSGGNRWQSAQWATARAFKLTMSLLTGITFEVEDPHDYLGGTRPAVFVGNHQSALDVLMLGCMFPKYCSVTAKSSLRNYPFLGWFMRLSGTIFIDRANSKDARTAMRGAADAILSQRQSVYMFPEGTRSYAQEATMLPFKKGAFHLAVQAGVPVVPVVVANYSHLYSTGKLRFLPGKIPIKVLEPIPTTGLTTDDVTALTERVREAMLQELGPLTIQGRAQALATATKGSKSAPIAVPAPTTAASDKGTSSGVSL
ncbi:lysophosphatidate acyltransferase [Sporothrix brasiliensis 5110]|uniref:1-acyl-sn-glycerol-3-phosphate acyltransferase n=1 Tax=Sporothrix brasiliensis 5110 TaxID=1398154 RepID=A0A0C2FHP7_9PEZI|nr:lysophosphatidate acyltransferase [Sporothrix brasiliensis 5110]KIH90598.1 lysophosphatidate acyltransferase [Sporothrix brasiliensis 5110]